MARHVCALTRLPSVFATLGADALQAAEPLIAARRQTAVQSAVGALGGYDLAQSGAVQLLE